MKIQHIRNACMIIHYKEHKVLVDPCLNPKGTLPPYTLFRKRPRLNPLVDLPFDSENMLSQITYGLITHCRYGHFDHLDKSGISLLAQKHVPVYCNSFDEQFLMRRRIRTIPLTMNQRSQFLTGKITSFPTAHGYGLAGMFMRPGAGYFIELPGEKSIYISGDTILNQTVRHVLNDLSPNIVILNAGTATLDFGKPILMPIREQMD